MSYTILKTRDMILSGLGTTFCFENVSAQITVPAAQNYVVLSQGSSETPGTVIANSADALGAMTAILGTDVGAHGLDAIASTIALAPKNRVLITEVATQETPQSDGREIYGLLQAETGSADGDAYNDTDKQAQISFVRPNAAMTALEAVPAGDIAGKILLYSYTRRYEKKDVPEDCSLLGGSTAGGTTIGTREITWIEITTEVASGDLIESGTNATYSGAAFDYTGLVFDGGKIEPVINGIDVRPGANVGAGFDLYPSVVPGEISAGSFYWHCPADPTEVLPVGTILKVAVNH